MSVFRGRRRGASSERYGYSCVAVYFCCILYDGMMYDVARTLYDGEATREGPAGSRRCAFWPFAPPSSNQ